MRAGTVAVLGVFALNGVVFGSWAPRVPALAAQIGAQEGALGLSLLGGSIGMIASALHSGALCARYGARIMVVATAIGGCAVLATNLSVALGVVGVIALAMAPLALLAGRARRRERGTSQHAVETTRSG